MDLELLIACVHERCAIWQTRHKNHFNRGIIDRYWEEIASALQTTKEAAKSKWKNMKDQFRKELKRVKKNTSGDEGGELQLSKWPYFSLMLFLKEEITMSRLSGNIRSRNKENENNDSENEDAPSTIERELYNSVEMAVEGYECDPGTGPEAVEPPKPTNLNLSRKRKETVQETVAKKMLVLEEKKLELLANQNKQLAEEESGDYHFLMSLLPHMKALSPLQNLRVRNKLTNVLINEMSKPQYYPGSASSSHSELNTFNFDHDYH